MRGEGNPEKSARHNAKMVDGMGRTIPAMAEEQDRLVADLVDRKMIDDVLEQPGIGIVIDWRGKHKAIGAIGNFRKLVGPRRRIIRRRLMIGGIAHGKRAVPRIPMVARRAIAAKALLQLKRKLASKGMLAYASADEEKQEGVRHGQQFGDTGDRRRHIADEPV